MGGLVARAVFLQPNYMKNSVDTLVTINSPHRCVLCAFSLICRPILLSHSSVASFYDSLDKYWTSASLSNHSEMKNVSIVSIGGGFRFGDSQDIA